MALPRIFHHIWLGSTPLPPDFAAFRETWREHHPEWALRLWTEEELPDGLSRRELYDLSRLPAERADVLRLEVLQRFGGIYVDVDLECRRPLDELLDRVEFFACYLSDPRAGSAVRIGNGIVGATRGHPIVELALDQVRFSDDGSLDKAATGTVFFTELLRGFPEAQIFERRLFYPLTRAEQRDAFAIHHWSRSWKTPEELRASLFKAETRLAEANEQVRRLREELASVKARRRFRLPWRRRPG